MGAPDLFIIKDALVSRCGLFRYWLTRQWDASLPVLLFVMLNPSTADAEVDDPTIRRCIGFARAMGYGAIKVVNLYAFRATSPKDLRAQGWQQGPDNDFTLHFAFEAAAILGTPVVCAWGAEAARTAQAGAVLKMMRGHGCEPKCLGKTAEGFPRHPLYVRGDAELVPFP